ncbi:MAG: SH3 domain-containing protein [Elainellaceae cyanobacterium]
MGKRDFGNTLNQAKPISLGQRQRVVSNSLGGQDSADVLEVRVKQRSSFSADLEFAGDRPKMALFDDANQDGQFQRRERIGRSRRDSSTGESLTSSKLDTGTYYLQVTPKGRGESDYQLTLNADSPSASGRSFGTQNVRISKKNWNARFLNRSRTDLTDYESYNFNNPDAIVDLGSQGKKRRTVAQLNVDYGMSSPDRIQKDRFAMEAWTRVRLRSGKFYRLSSDSDDGTRFLIKHRRSGEVLAEFNDNWNDRSVRDDEWSQIITPTQSGGYDLYVQYYENTGAAEVDVTLEKMRPQGEVLAAQLNVRNTPTTLNNTPTDVLSAGEVFKIKRQVQSSNDTVYQDWYKIVTADKTRGYVAAGSAFVDIVGEASNVYTIGGGTFEPPIPDDGTPGTPGTNNQGVISSSVWITSDDKISIRADKSISGLELGRVGAGTSLTLIEKVTGDRYLNSYDSWYRVRLNLNGRDQEGYVAAAYVDVLNDGGLYETGISKDNSAYKAHLTEVENPTYYWASYKPHVEQAASRYSWLDASVVAGIGSRESAWGRFLSPRGPGGTGDGGHGRGLMQIDDRYHQSFIASGRWSNPKDNIDYAVDQVLANYYSYLDRNTTLQGRELLRGAIAAYNSGLSNVTRAISQGRDVDYYTTGQDYSWDVLNRAGFFQSNGWT